MSKYISIERVSGDTIYVRKKYIEQIHSVSNGVRLCIHNSSAFSSIDTKESIESIMKRLDEKGGSDGRSDS